MFQTNSKVSIVIPSYNHAKFLNDRLKSIVDQSFQDFQMIIIDDCSSDESIEILNKFYRDNKDKVNHFIINKTNSGSGYKSWQKGIELANSPYIWIAETDDTAKSSFLNDAIEILENNAEVNLVFCASNIIDEKGEKIKSSFRRLEYLQVAEECSEIFDREVFLNNMPFKTFITNGSSVVFRKPEFGFPSEFFNYRQMTDAFVWTHLLTPGKFAFINKYNNSFRRHPKTTTVRMYQMHLKEVFFEKAAYLKYFNIPKYRMLLENYIKSYIWNNKRQVLDVQLVDFLGVERHWYFFKLLKVFIHKIRLKIIDKS